MIKLIIFDWDDVFTLGSKEGYFECYHKAIEGVGVSLEPEEEQKRILENWGKDHIDELSGLLREHPELVNKAGRIYEENLFGDTFTNCLSIIPGSIELLNSLHKKYILTLATGIHPRVFKEKIIPKFNIPNVFAQIITAYDINDPEKRKPHPFIAQEIMKTQRVSPHETVLVGDAKSDVELARNAGIVPIVVLTGHLTKKEAEDLKVDYIIKDVTFLEDILNLLNSRF